MNGEDLSDEEIQIMLGDEKEETTRMKCQDCGFEEDAPTWVLSESIEMDVALGVKKPVVTNGCPRCNGTMYIKEE